MNNAVKVAISADFLTAFAVLPRKVQGKVTEFINKFRNNPRASGINYEKIWDGFDNKICSVRIDDTYRGIVVRHEESGVYLLLWVDHHDEAYEWARRKRCEVNPRSGAIQVFDVQECISEKIQQTGLFSETADEDLLKLGLPAEQLVYVRGIATKEDFYKAADHLPKDAGESLSWLAEGFPVAEVIEMMEAEPVEITDGENLAEALDRPESMKSFVVVEGEDELRRIMEEPLEKWRVFLHPKQRKIVQKKYSGAARVLGGAGTGKTVVAMHRAKYLAEKLKEKEKILFTTFTANLAADIKDNLRKICSLEEMRHIEIINLDAWVAQFLREQGYKAEIAYGEKIQGIWEEAMSVGNESLGFAVSFYEEEWNRIIVAQEAFSLPLYVKATRNGRGTRLDRKKRMQVWKIFEAYQNILKEQQIRDINLAMYECKMVIQKQTTDMQYKHVIVDEAQDFSMNAFSLLRILAGEERENDLFIVGDSHQRIYKNRAVLSKCGIQVRGRSSLLKINYRTTEEIRKTAFALLNGISFDDMDDSIDNGEKCQSLTHGNAPEACFFKDASQEISYVVDEIKKLNANGVSLDNICVVARTHRLIEDYITQFMQQGIRSFEIKRSKTDNRGYEGLRVATMHRIKGLEFQYVFIVAANHRIIPLETAIDHTDTVSEQESLTAEKCLLYVAMTRAQKSVVITGYGKKSEFL
jgi:superfamily I DNA/RNA helicase